MLQKLINHNSDLKRLKQEGYDIRIFESYLIVSKVPYINQNKEIKFGTFISELTLAGENTTQPSTHTIFFSGEKPYNITGQPIDIICSESLSKEIGDVQIQYEFSHKPEGGYKDYFEKIETYVKIISHPAQSINPSVTAKRNHSVLSQDSDNDVFFYLDTNSSRAGIDELSKKMKSQKIAIVGLGGTGSYVLDLISKTPVQEIHLFDGDDLLSHNAFRTPGAIPKEQLNKKPKKVIHLKNVYSEMHKNIYHHEFNIDDSNINHLFDMHFVFICIDKSAIKKTLFDFLIKNKIAFIDTGIGVIKNNNSLAGHIRVNLCSPKHTTRLLQNISLSEEKNDDYSSNIQIAELNALNASLAIIKWKKTLNFYSDYEKEYTSIYTINTQSLVSEEHENKS